jgi:hypothetical protein
MSILQDMEAIKVLADDNLPEDENYCSNCLKPCDGVMVDNGIGCYEYWGRKDVDTNWCFESECCGSTVMYNGHEAEQPEPDFNEPDGDY